MPVRSTLRSRQNWISSSGPLFSPAPVCVCVCVCARARERSRERLCERLCVCVHVCACLHIHTPNTVLRFHITLTPPPRCMYARNSATARALPSPYSPPTPMPATTTTTARTSVQRVLLVGQLLDLARPVDHCALQPLHQVLLLRGHLGVLWCACVVCARACVCVHAAMCAHPRGCKWRHPVHACRPHRASCGKQDSWLNGAAGPSAAAQWLLSMLLLSAPALVHVLLPPMHSSTDAAH